MLRQPWERGGHPEAQQRWQWLNCMCTVSPRVSSQPCLEAQGSAGFVPCVISGTFALVVGTEPVSAAEMFSLLCSLLGHELVRPCTPSPSPLVTHSLSVPSS